jgi:hypothetical protein
VTSLKILLLALVLLTPSSETMKSSLRVGVRDSNGAAIAGAKIVVHWDPAGSSVGLLSNVGIKEDLRLETDQEGRFSGELPPGFYDIFVSSPAFSPECLKVRLKPGKTASPDFSLRADPLVNAEIGDRFESK